MADFSVPGKELGFLGIQMAQHIKERLVPVEGNNSTSCSCLLIPLHPGGQEAKVAYSAARAFLSLGWSLWCSER